MPIVPADFIAVADTLSLGRSEPSDRSAISRAYYGAFHHAKDWHEGLPAPGHDVGPRGGEHQMLINRLRNPDSVVLGPVSARQSRFLAAKLEVLRNRRVVADYQLALLVTGIERDQHISQAKALIRDY